MIADGDQKSVLLRLHDQIDESRAELSAEEIVNGFKPRIDPLIVEAVLINLVQSGLVFTIGAQPTRYRISRVGIAEVERRYEITTTINPSTGVVHRAYTQKSSPNSDLMPLDWGKWGAIAGWIAIPLTIIAIAVAIWLDKN